MEGVTDFNEYTEQPKEHGQGGIIRFLYAPGETVKYGGRETQPHKLTCAHFTLQMYRSVNM